MKAPSKKVELFWIGLFTYWIALLAIFAPAMISSRSDFLVFGGIAILAVSAYITYRIIIKKATNNHEAHRNDSAGPVDPGTGSMQ